MWGALGWGTAPPPRPAHSPWLVCCLVLHLTAQLTRVGGRGGAERPPPGLSGRGGNAEVGWERNSGSSLGEVLRQQKSDEETSPFTGGRTLAWPGHRERTRTALGTRTQQRWHLETQPGGVLFQPRFHLDWSLTCSPTPAPGAPPPNPGPPGRAPTAHQAP